MNGISCTMNRNTGTVATPTWNEFGNVADVMLGRSKESFKNTMRRNLGVHTYKTTGGNLEVKGKIKKPELAAAAGHPDFDDFAALEASWNLNSAIELAFADGSLTTNGAKGVRGWWEVHDFEEDQGNDNEVWISFTLKPADVPTAALATDTSLKAIRLLLVAGGIPTYAPWGSNTFA